MKLTHLHHWNVTPKEAVTIQIELAARLVDRPLELGEIRTVAGVDVSVKQGQSRAAVVVMRFPELTPIESVTATIPTPFPYVPGLLTFREGPALEHAFTQLQHEPDVFIFDGMGRIHPRRMGIAAHLGLWLERPTIGCGKTHFIGEYDMPDVKKGNHTDLIHHGERLGVVLRTRANVKPVYISPGHLCDIDSAVKIVMACTPKYRLPEPVRQAHKAAGTL